MAMEASEVARAATSLPSPETLVALARRRLSAELRALPPPGSPAWRAALLAELPAGVTFGALAHGVRMSARAGQMDDARDLFMALLRRIDGLNRRWIASVLWSLPAAASERYECAQDLAQELTLALWQQIGLRDDEAWELFFQRALAYAQGHVATTYLRRQGLRADPRAAQAERGLAIVFSRLVEEDGDDSSPPVAADVAAFARAELADLRALVARLPERERLAVVMRFWQRASEAEIAEALGGITTRAVRYILRRAYDRLRTWYAGEQASTADAGEESDERGSR